MTDLLRSYMVYTGSGPRTRQQTMQTGQTQRQNMQKMGFTSAQQAKAAIDSGLVTVSKEKKNNAGGYVFEVDDFVRARRFVILGSDKGSYYQGSVDLLKQNLDCFRALIGAGRSRELVDMIRDISFRGLAPKQDTIIFVLAWLSCQPQDEVRAAAFSVLPFVLRTPTDQFNFIFKWRKTIRESMALSGPGWGRAMRRVFKDKIYMEKPLKQLAYQVTKYQSRDGASQRDVLRLIHPAVGGKRKRDGAATSNLDAGRNLLFAWAVNGGKLNDDMEQTYFELLAKETAGEPNFGGSKDDFDMEDSSSVTQNNWQLLPYLKAIQEGLRTEDPKRAVKLIKEHGLVREQISTQVLKAVPVWGALLENMPMTALLRNLASMTSKGVFMENQYLNIAKKTLTNETAIQRARIHPLNVYKALKVYEVGRGDRGSLTWTPVRQIKDALNTMFKLAFKYGKPTGKKIRVCIDVSGSMGSPISGMNMTCREAAAVMSLAFLHAGDPVELCKFDFARGVQAGGMRDINAPHGLQKFHVREDCDVQDFMKNQERWCGGGTDCALPMTTALAKKDWSYDAFVVFTDNETWYGKIKPFEALAHYAIQAKKKDAKLIVCGMTATNFSIADPASPNMLDVVGLDSSVPQIVSEFIAGNV